jgi:hypothetical protein
VLAALIVANFSNSRAANGALVFAIVVVGAGLLIGTTIPYTRARARKLQVDNARAIRIARSAGADWASSARPAAGRELELAGLPHGARRGGLGAFRSAFRARGLLSLDLTGMHYRAPSGESQMWPFSDIDHVELRFEPEVGTVCLIVGHATAGHASTVFPVSLWDPDYSVGADLAVQLGHAHIITIDSRNLGPRWSGLREE